MATPNSVPSILAIPQSTLPPSQSGGTFRDVAWRNVQPSGRQQPRNSQQQQKPTTPRRNPTLVYGNGGNSNTDKFKLAADVNLVASGVSKDASPDQLRDFIIAKGVQVTDVELLTKFNKEEAISYTYRISIKPEDYEKALNPDVWPHRVGVRLFKNKRPQAQQNSWSYQSGQSGGNISNQCTAHSNMQRANVHLNPPAPLVDAPVTPLELQNRFVNPGFPTEVVN